MTPPKRKNGFVVCNRKDITTCECISCTSLRYSIDRKKGEIEKLKKTKKGLKGDVWTPEGHRDKNIYYACCNGLKNYTQFDIRCEVCGREIPKA